MGCGDPTHNPRNGFTILQWETGNPNEGLISAVQIREEVLYLMMSIWRALNDIQWNFFLHHQSRICWGREIREQKSENTHAYTQTHPSDLINWRDTLQSLLHYTFSYFKIYCTFNYVYMWFCVWVCDCECSAGSGQKRALYPLELKLQVVISYLLRCW